MSTPEPETVSLAKICNLVLLKMFEISHEAVAEFLQRMMALKTGQLSGYDKASVKDHYPQRGTETKTSEGSAPIPEGDEGNAVTNAQIAKEPVEVPKGNEASVSSGGEPGKQ
jgi:hypothetical protein